MILVTAASGLASAGWAVGAVVVLRWVRPTGWHRDIAVGLALLGALVLAMPAFSKAAATGTTPGGLSSLGAGGALATVTLSVALATVLFVLVGLLVEHGGRRAAPVLALATALTFVTLSTQLYYELYRALIPGLPAQWVVAIPSLAAVADMLAIWREGPLGDRLRGATVWVAVARTLPYVRPGRGLAALFGAGLATLLHALAG